MFSKPYKNIKSGTVHLHVVEVSSTLNEFIKDACLRHLSPEEKIKWQRFRFEKDKNIHLVAKALVREQLSNYLGGEVPGYWKFKTNSYGKPFISNCRSETCLNFNISHAKNYVICAFTIGRELGVDVEYINADININELALQHFSSIEISNLFNIPSENQLDKFYEYWTFKEAYIKAIGMGLSIPLDDFCINFDKENVATVAVRDYYDFANRKWQFKRLDGFKKCKAVICVENNDASLKNIQVEIFKTKL